MTIIDRVETPDTRVRVVLVDDHELLRRGLKTLLEASDEIEVVGQAANGEEVARLVAELLPDVVLIDIVMPKKNGIDATREIKEAFPNVGVIVLTGHSEEQYVFDAIKAGASGYFLKDADLQRLVDKITSVAKGGGEIEPGLADKILSEFTAYQENELGEVFQPLTPREREILQLMRQGLPNKTIASRLTISERTVTTHVANTYAKLHVNNRVSAIQEAMRRRILPSAP